MPQTENGPIKALIELLDGETGPRAELLRQELARVMKEQPQRLHEVIEQDFHSSVPAALVTAMEEVNPLCQSRFYPRRHRRGAGRSGADAAPAAGQLYGSGGNLQYVKPLFLPQPGLSRAARRT